MVKINGKICIMPIQAYIRLKINPNNGNRVFLIEKYSIFFVKILL